MNTDSKLNLIYYSVTALLAVGIFYGYSIPIILFVIFFRSITLEKDSLGVFLCIYGGVLGGTIRSVFPAIPIYGLMMQFLGLIFLSSKIRMFFRESLIGLLNLIGILSIFIVFYFLGPQDDFSRTKITEMCINGILFMIAFYSIFRSGSFDNNGIAQLLLLSSIFYIKASQVTAPIGAPSSFLDFSWYRQASVYLAELDDSTLIVDYQTVGMNALFALGFILSKKVKFASRTTIIAFVTCVYLSLLSGARQSIFGILFVTFAYFAVFQSDGKHKLNMKYVTFACVIVFLGIEILSMLDIEFISSVLENDSQKTIGQRMGRAMNYAAGVEMVSTNFILGTGIGGYHAKTGFIYPHNFFLEILCECGFIGLLMLGILMILYVKNLNITYLLKTFSGLSYFLIYFCSFLRLMVSESLSGSILLFSALLSLSCIKKIKNNGQYNNNHTPS